MGKSILVMGEAGTGKSRAILNLPPEQTVILSPNAKDLPFKGAGSKYNSEKKNFFQLNSFPEVGKYLKHINDNVPEVKYVIIEDLTHYLSGRVMGDAKIVGYNKWTDLAVDVFNSIIKLGNSLRDDLWLIVIGHTATSSDVMGNQIITLQTPGRLLENAIKIPSYFTYVLHTDPVMSADGATMDYRFLTNTDGIRIAKSPEGCLEKYEPNDYAVIISKIINYQNN